MQASSEGWRILFHLFFWLHFGVFFVFHEPGNTLFAGSQPSSCQAVNVMVTIGLQVAKKLHIIEGTNQDFSIGEKAKTSSKSYSELIDTWLQLLEWA